MQFTDYKALTIFGFALAIYMALAFINSAPFNENMLYSLFIYGLGISQAMPVFTGKPLIVPYSGTKLLKGDEQLKRKLAFSGGVE